ncbi:MAG: PstS family phosphate ABC transporter substrate-binding protein [Pseudonocardiaceae bacterium]
MDWLNALRSLTTGPLSPGSVIPSLVAFLLSGLSLVLNHFLKRKRLSWRERYNSKIGLVSGFTERNPRIEQFIDTLANTSVLIIRIRNTGRSTITASDYHEPLRITFKNRFILDFRVSTPRPRDIRDKVENSAFVSQAIDDFGNPPENIIKLPALREALSRTLSASSDGDPFTNDEKDIRRQLTIPELELKPTDEFTIVIDLREAMLSPDLGSTDKEYSCRGKLRSGKLVDQNIRGRALTLTRSLSALFLLLLGGLIATIIGLNYPAAESYCTQGEIALVGSSAFAPTADSISKAYTQACAGASISAVEQDGSLQGVRQVLEADPSDSSRLAAFSDGQATGNVGPLTPKPVAILVYSLVVNKVTNIDSLSLEQIQGIYQGRYTNWRQLGGAMDLPIRVVGRDASSGTRQTFERYVLKFPEPAVSSNDCVTKDRDPAAPVIRCERETTAQILDQVNRTPGAIGYADTTEVAKYRNISRARLDGLEPTEQYLQSGYPFWTIEYLYTNGVPAAGSLLNSYVDYFSSDAARSRIRDHSYAPCVQPDGYILDLCGKPR